MVVQNEALFWWGSGYGSVSGACWRGTGDKAHKSSLGIISVAILVRPGTVGTQCGPGRLWLSDGVAAEVMLVAGI